MKKEYTKPEMEVIQIITESVLANTSSFDPKGILNTDADSWYQS